MNQATPRAVIFDLDGTLLNTLADLADAMNESLRIMKLPTHPEEAYRWFVGKGMRSLAEQALPEGQGHRLDECVETMKKCYAENWNHRTEPYEGIPLMLKTLAAEGVAMSVLSNKNHHFTRQCVAQYFPSVPFQQVVGVSDQTPPKPDPTGLRAVLHQMGHPPDAFLYMGDTAIDMKTAAAMDLFSVGVSWGFRPRGELENAGARAIIDHPDQFLQFFKP